MKNYLSEQDLLNYFDPNGGEPFGNAEGVLMGRLDSGEIWTMFRFYVPGTGHIEISTEDHSLRDFITGFRIRTVRDLDHLGKKDIRRRYLEGEAEVTVLSIELDASLGFRLYKSRTLIYSTELYFYDEVSGHLTRQAEFIRYILQNKRKLHIACENRYRMNRN